MKVPSLVKLPQNRQFKFKPRHYDPVMEDLDERVTKIRQEMGDDTIPENQRKTHINFRAAVKNKGNTQSKYIRLGVFFLILINGYTWLMVGFTLIFKILILTEISIAYILYRVQKSNKG